MIIFNKESPFQTFTKKIFLFCKFAIQCIVTWLHLQALLQSTFDLVSAFVFSVQNILGPTVICLIFFQIYVNYLNIIVNILLPLTFLVVMNICIYRIMGNQWYRKIVINGLAETDQNQETKSCLNHSTS